MEKVKADDEILTDKEVQERYRVSAATLYRARTKSKPTIPHFRVRSELRYRVSEIEAYFRKGKQCESSVEAGRSIAAA